MLHCRSRQSYWKHGVVGPETDLRCCVADQPDSATARILGYVVGLRSGSKNITVIACATIDRVITCTASQSVVTTVAVDIVIYLEELLGVGVRRISIDLEGGEVETKYFLTLFAVLRIVFSTVREALESSNIVAMKV